MRPSLVLQAAQKLAGNKSAKDASVKVEDILRKAESTAEDSSLRKEKLDAAVLSTSEEKTAVLKDSDEQPSSVEVSKALPSYTSSQS